MIGIYKIISPTNKIYIGQSWSIEKRKNQYCNYRCKNQPKLYNSLLKYGFEKHEFVIEYIATDNISQQELNEKEYYYWKLYVNNGFEMLNLKEANGCGGKLSDDTKQKISKKRIEGGYYGNNHPLFGTHRSDKTKELLRKANIGKKVTPYVIDKITKKLKGVGKSQSHKEKHMKSIIQIDLNNNEIKIWKSIKEAGETLTINKSNICRCCKNQIKTAGGYVWKYE